MMLTLREMKFERDDDKVKFEYTSLCERVPNQKDRTFNLWSSTQIQPRE